MKWSNDEMCKMICIFAQCNYNGRQAARFFRERYPQTVIFPRDDEIRRLYRRLETTGSFYPAKRQGEYTKISYFAGHF